MDLFVIKRKSDGKFFASREAYYSLHSGQNKTRWSTKPTYFLRTPDGVVGNLRKICSEPYWEAGKGGREDWPWRELGFKNFDATLLDNYCIQVLKIALFSEVEVEVSDFAKVSDIESAPLTRRERGAFNE